jgi:hypothetical protein
VLLTDARPHHVSVVYSTVMNGSIQDPPDALAAPTAGNDDRSIIAGGW